MCKDLLLFVREFSDKPNGGGVEVLLLTDNVLQEELEQGVDCLFDGNDDRSDDRTVRGDLAWSELDAPKLTQGTKSFEHFVRDLKVSSTGLKGQISHIANVLVVELASGYALVTTSGELFFESGGLVAVLVTWKADKCCHEFEYLEL